MRIPTENDRLRFAEHVSRLRLNADGCMRMAPNFKGSEGSFRSYQMYWLHINDTWPGRLKQTCTTEGCVVHYSEQGHVLTPGEVEAIKTAKDYWGLTTELAAKYKVSKARISQIRNEK